MYHKLRPVTQQLHFLASNCRQFASFRCLFFKKKITQLPSLVLSYFYLYHYSHMHTEIRFIYFFLLLSGNGRGGFTSTIYTYFQQY